MRDPVPLGRKIAPTPAEDEAMRLAIDAARSTFIAAAFDLMAAVPAPDQRRVALASVFAATLATLDKHVPGLRPAVDMSLSYIDAHAQGRQPGENH